MPNINSETVCFLINKAREFHAKEGVVITDTPNSPADDWARQVLADHADDETYQEFVATFNDLEPDQQYDLVALFWIGREDFDMADWDQAVAEARDNQTPQTPDYLLSHPMLADFLLEGLQKHGLGCE